MRTFSRTFPSSTPARLSLIKRHGRPAAVMVIASFGAYLENFGNLVYGDSMRRRGINPHPTLHMKGATVIIAVLFSLQGIGVSFFSALPETKSRFPVCKSLSAQAQYETKKSLKLVALSHNAVCFEVVFTASSNVTRRSCAVLLSFQATVPNRGPPAIPPSHLA